MISFLLVVAFAVAPAIAIGVEFSYDDQDSWPGICVSGNEGRQSPIDILTENVEIDSSLIDLVFTGWSERSGTFTNTGHNVQFDLDSPTAATVRNHLGTYDLLQFHMHWGNATGQGSEHIINGIQEELEIHFVHRKQRENNTNAQDYYCVVGVIAEVDEEAISGPWSLLDASAVREYKSNITIEEFNLETLLPSDRTYYHYLGSLTTPLCSETVAWFVMQNTIRVPAAYLEQLRMIQNNAGMPVQYNFRDVQSLGDRTVRMPGSSQAINSPIVLLLEFCLILATATLY